MSPDSRVVFFHIPKTAGTTLTTIFEKLFAGRTQYLVGRQDLSHYEDCLKFIGLPEHTRNSYAYIAGHLEMPAIAAIPGRPFIFTFLRHPAERLASLYHFVKRTPSHHMHSWITDRNASLPDFIESCPWDEVYNGMTRRLSGLRLARMNHKMTLSLAIDNLQKYFSFIGIQEQFDQSLLYLGHMLGMDRELLVYRKINCNPNSAITPAMEPALRDRIRAINAMDFELYEFCQKELTAKLSPLFQGPGLAEIEAFKREVQDLAERA